MHVYLQDKLQLLRTFKATYLIVKIFIPKYISKSTLNVLLAT